MVLLGQAGSVSAVSAPAFPRRFPGAGAVLMPFALALMVACTTSIILMGVGLEHGRPWVAYSFQLQRLCL